jgi:hypothetical protein
MIAKVERPGSTSSSQSSSALRGWDAAVACAWGASRSRAFSVLEAALALLRASGNDIGEDDDGDVVPQVPPARPVACDHPPMEVKGATAVRFDSRSGVTPHDSDTFRLPLSIFIVGAERQMVPFGICLRHYFSQTATWRAPPRSRCASMPTGQRQRSCSVGAAKLMSHACDSAQLHPPPHSSIERIEKYPHPASHQQHQRRDPPS